MRSVLVAMPRIPHYRIPLLLQLHEELAQRGIRLRSAHGDTPGSMRLEQDGVQLAWSESLRRRRVPGLRGRVVWLPVSALSQDVDLVVVPEVSGWLATYELLIRRRHEGYRVACWGHGPGPDDHARSRFSRRVRTALARQFDWWFTYTEGTTRRLVSAGVTPERITTLYNTVDVATLRDQVEQARGNAAETRDRLTLRGPTALFLGTLRASKRIDVLLEVAALVADRVEGFALVVGGDGPERYLIESALGTSPWLRYVGPIVGEEKARLLSVADLMLQPAWLGLVVLDAFAAGLPIVTFDRADHSPEEEYVRNGVEGIRVVGNNPLQLADAVIQLLNDSARRMTLAEGARRAGYEHSIEDMARRFAEGIERALD